LTKSTEEIVGKLTTGSIRTEKVEGIDRKEKSRQMARDQRREGSSGDNMTEHRPNKKAKRRKEPALGARGRSRNVVDSLRREETVIVTRPCKRGTSSDFYPQKLEGKSGCKQIFRISPILRRNEMVVDAEKLRYYETTPCEIDRGISHRGAKVREPEKVK
jgi:hypothetical protein